MNPFVPILHSAGFTESITGRWVSPDSKFDDAAPIVEVSDRFPVAYLMLNGSTFSFRSNDVDLAHFRKSLFI
jgi:hypothetical protein